MINSISYSRVRELFDYHEDGYLIWKIQNGNSIKIGDVAGSSSGEDRSQVQIDGTLYGAHRIIFLFHHKYLPELVDHEDKDKLNNKINNLRDVSRQCNNRNASVRKDNTSGVKGVCWHKKHNKWISRITLNKKLIHLGIFEHFEDAVKVRYEAEVELNWKGCETRSSAFLYMEENNLL